MACTTSGTTSRPTKPFSATTTVRTEIPARACSLPWRCGAGVHNGARRFLTQAAPRAGEPQWAPDYGLKAKRPDLYAEMQAECGGKGYALSR